MNKKFFAIVLLLFLCTFVSACTKNISTENDKYNYYVSNYNFYGEKHEVGLKAEPKKVIVCGNSGIDTLIALGVADKIKAAVLTDLTEKEKYQNLLPQVPIYVQPLSLEKVTEMQPDFILGWRRFFGKNGLEDTSKWIAKGIPAYIQDASGPIPAKGNFPKSTIASEKNFIRNMGIVFNKQQKAEQYIKKIDALLQQKQNFLMQDKQILIVEFINGNIEVFGNDLLIGDIVKEFGGNIIEYSAPFVSQEEIINTAPDVIFVVYHGDEQAQQQALKNLDNPLYQHLCAVKTGKVYPLNYRLAVAPGINVIQTMNYIAECLDS